MRRSTERQQKWHQAFYKSFVKKNPRMFSLVMQTSSAALTNMCNPFFDPIVFKSMSTTGQYAYEQIPFLKGTQVACFDGAIMTNERFISSFAHEWQFVCVKPST